MLDVPWPSGFGPPEQRPAAPMTIRRATEVGVAKVLAVEADILPGGTVRLGSQSPKVSGFCHTCNCNQLQQGVPCACVLHVCVRFARAVQWGLCLGSGRPGAVTTLLLSGICRTHSTALSAHNIGLHCPHRGDSPRWCNAPNAMAPSNIRPVCIIGLQLRRRRWRRQSRPAAGCHRRPCCSQPAPWPACWTMETSPGPTSEVLRPNKAFNWCRHD
jgi:hypothetical protein